MWQFWRNICRMWCEYTSLSYSTFISILCPLLLYYASFFRPRTEVKYHYIVRLVSLKSASDYRNASFHKVPWEYCFLKSSNIFTSLKNALSKTGNNLLSGQCHALHTYYCSTLLSYSAHYCISIPFFPLKSSAHFLITQLSILLHKRKPVYYADIISCFVP